jgi:O-antigen/teichoic acid export membrane protein
MFMTQSSIQNTFLKSILSFGMVQVLSQMVSFFLLPLYTAKLSTIDYGVMEFVTIINAVLLIIFSFQVQQGVMRQLVDASDDKQKAKIVSTCFWFNMVSFILLIGTQLLVYLVFNKQWYYGINNLSLFPITLTSLFFTAINSYLNAILVWRLQSVKSSIISAISIVVNITLAIYFVLYLNMGIKGTMLAALIAQVSISPFLLLANRHFVKFHFDKSVLFETLRFSVPIIFSVLAYYSWFFIDRYLLNKFLGTSELGIFSVAMRFAAPIGLVLAVVESSVFPIVLNNYKDQKTKFFLSDLFDVVTFGFSILLLGIACFSIDIFGIMVKGDFIRGHELCLLLCFGQLFSKMYYFNPGFAIEKKTNIFLLITVVSSIINFCINFLLIPNFGIIGACIATCFSSFIYFLVLFYHSNKLYPIMYSYKKPALNMVLIFVGYMYLMQNHYHNRIIIFLLIMCCILFLNKKLIKKSIDFGSQFIQKKQLGI